MSLEKTLNEHGVYTYPLDVPISAESRESIEYALDAIDRALDVDGCDCDDDCTIESPKCRYRELAAARHRLQKALDPIHRSLHPDRQGSLSERIYLKRWIKEQERMSHLNDGYGLLELILSPTRIPSRYGGGRYYVPPWGGREWLIVGINYSQWTPEDKIRVSHSILAKTVHQTPAGQRTTQDENTFTIAEIMFYARAMRVAVKSNCVFGSSTQTRGR